MNYKRIGVLLFVFLLVFGLFGGVFAQDDSQGLGEQVDDFQEDIEDIRAFDWDEYKEQHYVGNDFEFRDFFLKSKSIARVDSFLKKLDPLFVILFARKYTISLGMLFVFMLWLFTLLSLTSYTSAFEHVGFEDYGLSNFVKSVLPLVITVLLAQIQVFNYVTQGIIKAIFGVFGDAGPLWSLLMAVLLFGAVIGYYFLNRHFAKALKKVREKKKEHEDSLKLKKLEERDKAIKKAIEGP